VGEAVSGAFRRLGFMLFVSCAALASQTAAARPKPAAAQSGSKRIAVAQFEAPADSRARMGVLTTLSDHADVEVVSLEDIVMAGKRIQASPDDPAGRRKLSKELGIDAWLDGTVDGESARVTLRTSEGRTLAVANLSDERPERLDRLIGERVWKVMGVWLSSREQRQRELEAQYELALQKVQAREQELVRQREQVKLRAAERGAQLRAAQSLARQKRAAHRAEIARQRTVVAQRSTQLEQERKRDEERRLAAEEAEFVASLQESSGPAADLAPQSTNAWAVASPQPPAASAWATEPTAAQPARSAPAARSNQPAAPAYSPWLMSPGATVGAGRTPEHAAAAATSPAPTRAAPTAVAGPDPNTAGLSPATRRWLAEQQAQR
jgi:hypothetical protein